MKVVVAVDSFKGSLGSTEAGDIIKEGILEEVSDAEVIVRPLAENTKARYGVVGDTAIMEMAESSGLTLVAKD